MLNHDLNFILLVEQALTECLDASGLKWTLNPGDGAFYGPKVIVDLQSRFFEMKVLVIFLYRNVSFKSFEGLYDHKSVINFDLYSKRSV